MKLRVAFDAAELGPFAWSGDRGVRRVVENVAAGLAAHPRVAVHLVGVRRSAGVRGVADRFANGAMRFAKQTVANRTPPLRVMRRLLVLLAQAVEESSRRLPSSVLHNVDVVHFPFRPVPAALRSTRSPAVFVTIFDLIPLKYPELVDQRSIDLVGAIVASLTEHVWITCISYAVKQDICETLKIPAERVFVTPLAASGTVFHPVDAAEREAVQRQYGLADSPYVLSLSAIDRRKNLRHLVDCFARLSDQPAARNLKLVLVGPYYPDTREFIELRSRHPALRERIVFTGFVPNEDLAAIYSGAFAFAFPSLAEGFGLPALEAMQCGVPVISSNATSLPEVVGDAGFLLDPHDQHAWADAMLRLLTDAALREQLSAKSHARAAEFTWAKTVDALLSAYDHALAHGA